jgi:hypothetical protein
MGKRKHPRLTPSEVTAILTGFGFTARSIVTVDMAYSEFDDDLIKSMIRQSNRSREMFYGATKRTARKASVQFLKLTSEDSE